VANSLAYREVNRDKTAAYMHARYLTHEGLGRQRVITLGAGRETKKCKKCGITKGRAEFTIMQSGPRVGHFAGYCKPCSSARTSGTYKQNHARDPNRYRQIEWPSKLKRLYGITVADYNRLLEAQNGGCALCGTKNPLPGNRSYVKNGKQTQRTVFDVDHNHTTGKVRGLLCTRCNRLVGLANDSADTARCLVEYLSCEEN